MKDIMDTYNISVGSPDQQPFSHRVKKMCGSAGAFLKYKKIRRDILIDKESHPEEEPYHIRMLREQEAEEERLRQAEMEKSDWSYKMADAEEQDEQTPTEEPASKTVNKVQFKHQLKKYASLGPES